MNVFQATKRGVATLDLVERGQVWFRMTGGGQEARSRRRWRTPFERIGWHLELTIQLGEFLDAGMVDYPRPKGVKVDEFHPDLLRACQQVELTRAGARLLDLWRRRPFKVLEHGDVAALDRAARALSIAYIEQSGLLEDPPLQYAERLRPHAAAALAAACEQGDDE